MLHAGIQNTNNYKDTTFLAKHPIISGNPNQIIIQRQIYISKNKLAEISCK